MEALLEGLRGAWAGASRPEWPPAAGSGVLAELRSRCGVTRAEPVCVIGPEAAAPGAAGAATVGCLPRIREEPTGAPQDSPPAGGRRPEAPAVPQASLAAPTAAAAAPPPAQAQGVAAAATSARSDTSWDSEMASEEREREKQRLQRLLKDFAKESMAGIPVNLVNPRTGRMPPYVFQMDRHLTVFSLKPKDGSAVESLVEDFKLRDIVSIYKGHGVSIRAPRLGGDAAECVGLDVRPAERSLLLHFDDTYERDRFYTSLQLLKMSADIQRPG
mmetsp:Transcript_8840/g.27198  ORF Transcript_8840/g.27198 Transcript_8840/m.27198 type:complete len:273 (-) Transcript_8840:156-974(-)